MATIAIAGKGGSGKTTIAGTLARVLARSGREVWAIDADSTPNLAITLGLSRDEAAGLMPMPRSILDENKDAVGKRVLTLGMTPAAVVDQFGRSTPDHVKLLLMGRVDHAGAG
jgi:CO dehydrogenase maturation factor